MRQAWDCTLTSDTVVFSRRIVEDVAVYKSAVLLSRMYTGYRRRTLTHSRPEGINPVCPSTVAEETYDICRHEMLYDPNSEIESGRTKCQL